MSLIQEYRQTEEAIKELQERLAKIQSDERFQREREFEGQLRDLLGAYGKSLRDVISILDPQPALGQVRQESKRKRRMKVYRNPHTEEVIETKGGNHRQLKAWKEKYGADEVEGWASFA